MRLKKIVIVINFNDVKSLSNSVSPEWINYRMAIFNRFTLKSLKNQLNQDFIVFIRYLDKTETYIKKALNQYDKLPKNIMFIRGQALERHLLENLSNYDYLYIVRLDSDDLFHNTFIQQLYDYKPKADTVALINQKGYLYDSIHNRMMAISRDSPPFYTLIYKTKDFIAGKRHVFKGHNSVIHLRHELINRSNYIVVIHSRNTSSRFPAIAKGTDTFVEKPAIPALLGGYM